MSNFEKFKNNKGTYKWLIGDFIGVTEEYQKDDAELVYFSSGRRIFKNKLEEYLEFIEFGEVDKSETPSSFGGVFNTSNELANLSNKEETVIPTVNAMKKYVDTEVVDEPKVKPKISDKRVKQFNKLLKLDIEKDEHNVIDLKLNVPSERTQIMLEMLDLNWKTLLKEIYRAEIEKTIDEL